MKKYTEMRDNVTSSALVYKEKIYPLAKIVVEHIDRCFQNYEVLSFEEWKDDLQVLLASSPLFHKEIFLDIKIIFII